MFLNIEDLMNKLTLAINKLAKNGRDYAQAEYDYKTVLNQTALRLKAEGMAVTLIQLIIYGEKEVATARLKRDIAKTNYDANIEFINSIKLQLRLMDSQAQREWNAE